jgi:hypothetical protein
MYWPKPRLKVPNVLKNKEYRSSISSFIPRTQLADVLGIQLNSTIRANYFESSSMLHLIELQCFALFNNSITNHEHQFFWQFLATCRAGILPASYLATTNGRPTFPFKPQTHVGRAFLPASYLATTNGRPTFPFKPQTHVGRASFPPHTWRPQMVALHTLTSLKPM